ncbi:uncharacterized protein A4U43_C08F11540 [Asparagus officinalis]|nr:uncharacterized protein A4U43_C08F11540 [Asparagus officinalis]
MVGLTKEVVASNSIKEGDVDLEVVMKVSVEKEGVGGAHDEVGTIDDGVQTLINARVKKLPTGIFYQI